MNDIETNPIYAAFLQWLDENVVPDAVRAAMPHYSLGEDFAVTLPHELIPYFAEWRAGATDR